jgi:alkylation response protein AidB-like acyl-CoA dehydrogenase
MVLRRCERSGKVSGVDFSFSDEQEELRSSVRRFLAANSPESAVRQAMATDTGYDRRLWQRLSSELGLTALAIPEKFGGAGYGMLETGLVLQEMGRALLCAPFLSSAVLGANALIESGDLSACERWLPELAAGTSLATMALSASAPASAHVYAARRGDSWTLTGRAGFVLDGHIANLVIVAVSSDGLAESAGSTVSEASTGSTSLFVVESGAAGFDRQLLDTFDSTRKLADLTFADTPATLIGVEGGAAGAVARTTDLAVVALSLESVGVAERALEMATEYAKVREQFGRPIGSFQAIKHKLADVLLEVEAARSAGWYALWAAAERPEELAVVASLTASTCAEAAYLAAAENIQVHGGMGCAWEHPAHLYFRRATTSRLLFGEPDRHRSELLDRLGYDSQSDTPE